MYIYLYSWFLRKYVITQMKIALQRREISEGFFDPDPEQYLAAMSRNYNFVDNLFLKFFATLSNRDIIIILVHSESACVRGKEFTWIFGK